MDVYESESEGIKIKNSDFVYVSRIPDNILEHKKVVGRLKHPQNRRFNLTHSQFR